MDEEHVTETEIVEEAPEPPKRGFAKLSRDELQKLSSLGGRTAHRLGRANKFDSQTASVAAKIAHSRGTAHRWTSEKAREVARNRPRAT